MTRSSLLRYIHRAISTAARVIAFLVLLDALLFAIFDLLPSAALGQLGVFALDPSLLEEARVRMGISGPWYERFAGHWSTMLHGSLGYSIQGHYPIAEVFKIRLLRSLPLWLGTFFLLPIAFVLGLQYASRRQRLSHHLGRWLGHFSTVPQFLSSIVLFVAWLLLAQGASVVATGVIKWMFAVASCAMLPFGVLFVSSANTFESLASERFCDTYLSVGMSWAAVQRRIAFNAIVALRPLIARLVLWTITGSVLTETIFGISGFGQLLVEAMRGSDLNVARSWMFLVGGLVLVVTEIERR